MSETALSTTQPAKTVDEIHHYRGYHDIEPRAFCRVRILQPEQGPPIVILSELPEHDNTSVTNLIEQIAAEVISKHLPHRWDVLDSAPAIVIEHYPPDDQEYGLRRGKPTYDWVEFDDWRPRQVYMFGGPLRLSLRGPKWRHMPADEVRALIGSEADDLEQDGR